MALHTEHLRKSDESYEIRHDNNGNAIHVFIKDGEAIIFPTLWDLIEHNYHAKPDIERFYVSDEELSDIYDNDDSYDYYAIKRQYEKSKGKKIKPFVQEIMFTHDGRNYKLVLIVEEPDFWVTMEQFDIHYSEDYNEICVYIQGDVSKSIHSQKIK